MRLAPSMIVCCAALVACGGPTVPDRAGAGYIYLECTSVSGMVLNCRAPIHCGSYGCLPGTPTDVTAAAIWTSGDPSIAKVIGPGLLQSVHAGYTTVHASTPTYDVFPKPIGVFGDGPPLPVYEIDGSIYDGPVPASSYVNGAAVEVLNGFVAGRRAISGQSDSTAVPGFSPLNVGPGYYRIIGVPPGTFRIRVTKDGYAPQERDVTTAFVGGAVADFQLQRQ